MALFPIPTREELFSYFIGDYTGAQPTKNVARGSDPYRLGRVVSGAIWNVLSKLLYFVKQALPDTAEAAFLERWGSVYAFPRNAAHVSFRSLALRVSGTVAAAVPVDSELAHSDGTLYRVATTGAVIGAGGYVDVDVESKSTGVATNKGAGTILTFTSTPPSLTSTATIQLQLEGGADIEDYEAYRVRLLAHLADPPQGGAIHDYLAWTKAVSGVSEAYIFSGRRGMGTIDIAALGPGTGAARDVGSDVRDAIELSIEDKRPGGARDFAVLTTTTQSQDVVCTIEIDEETYGWDWDDDGVGYAITAFDSNAKTITSPTAPAAVVTGVRIQVKGEEAIVTNRVGNVLTLTFENDYDGNAVTWFSFTATSGVVRASGDLVRPVKNAILGLFNTLGPARSKYARTSWTSSLKLSRLNGVITDVAGVDDVTTTTPAATVTLTDTYGTSIAYLVPGYIEVLKP